MIWSWDYIIYYALNCFIITLTRFAGSNGNMMLWQLTQMVSILSVMLPTTLQHCIDLPRPQPTPIQWKMQGSVIPSYGSVKILQKFVKTQLFAWDNSLLTFMVSYCSWLYCTILIDSSPMWHRDTADKIFISSLGFWGCDKVRISSGVRLRLDTLALFGSV